MNTIHIVTSAYNAEKTLRRAIDSILAQTYKNYKIYVCDNGSTDGTRAIVEEYAEKHGIIPFYNEENYVYNEKSIGFHSLAAEIPPDDFWARLDADDELFPENFETLINFANENNLDIAAGGIEGKNVITGESGEYFTGVTSPTVLTTDKKEWDDNFRSIYFYMTAFWGKLIRGTVSKLIADFYLAKPDVLEFGRDTMVMMSVLDIANRVGVIPEMLLRYYIHPGSISYAYNKGRIYFPENAFKATHTLISEKAGYISSENLTFLYRYFCAEFREVFRVHLWVDIDNAIKLDEISYLCNAETTRDLYSQVDYFEIYKNKNKAFDLFDQPLEWIFKNLKTLPPERVLKLYYLFFNVIYQSKPVKFTYEEIRYMLSASVPLANSLLLGIFDNANVVFTRLPDSEIKKAIMQKIERLK